MRFRQTKGGHNFKEDVASSKKRREKYQRDEQRQSEQLALERAIEEERYWAPVDKADHKHRMKLQARQQK